MKTRLRLGFGTGHGTTPEKLVSRTRRPRKAPMLVSGFEALQRQAVRAEALHPPPLSHQTGPPASVPNACWQHRNVRVLMRMSMRMRVYTMHTHVDGWLETGIIKLTHPNRYCRSWEGEVGRGASCPLPRAILADGPNLPVVEA
eukprot:15453685-Alexandrium_andersonii.AAC.1